MDFECQPSLSLVSTAIPMRIRGSTLKHSRSCFMWRYTPSFKVLASMMISSATSPFPISARSCLTNRASSTLPKASQPETCFLPLGYHRSRVLDGCLYGRDDQSCPFSSSGSSSPGTVS